jgi:hypothetical protein
LSVQLHHPTLQLLRLPLQLALQLLLHHPPERLHLPELLHLLWQIHPPERIHHQKLQRQLSVVPVLLP